MKLPGWLRSCGPACELALALVGSLVVWGLSSHFDFLEGIYLFSRSHENWELDELVCLAIFWLLAAAILLWRRQVMLRKTMNELRETNTSLRDAMEQIRRLEGLLCMCSGCRRIQEKDGRWVSVETYVTSHSQASFTHGLCPNCARELYPDLDLSDIDTAIPPPETLVPPAPLD